MPCARCRIGRKGNLDYVGRAATTVAVRARGMMMKPKASLKARVAAQLGLLILAGSSLVACAGDNAASAEGDSFGKSSQALTGLALDKLVSTHQGSASKTISAPAL